MTKRIMVLANNSSGLYGFRKELLFALCQGNEIIVSVPDDGNFSEITQLGCRTIDTPVDRRGINPKTDWKLFVGYWKLLRKEKPDLVITYTIKPNIYGGLACRLLRIPYAINITGLGTAFQKQGLLRKLVTCMYRVALKKAKVVFFENSTNMALFQKLHLATEKQCCLLNGAGVNLEHFTYAPYPEDGMTRFLFVGRVMAEKGINELFGAMERLHTEGIDCTLDVLGGYEEDYKEIIEKHQQQGWLRYHGFVKDVRPYIQNAHCFVLPSYHEGMANTNLECAAMGRPLITSDIPGCREAVILEQSGLLCQSKDEDSLYEAMKHFLSLPHAEKAQMGRCGRAHMEAVFDKKKVVEATVKELF